jgi:hypothetical protein
MGMNQEQAVITAIYDRIMLSVELQVIASGIQLYLVQPDEESPGFPYLCHRVALGTPSDSVVNRGTYYLDILDFHDTGERTTRIRGELLKLLDHEALVVGGGETAKVRLHLESNGFVPTDETNVWHYALAFHIRYGRILEIAGINDTPFVEADTNLVLWFENQLA